MRKIFSTLVASITLALIFFCLDSAQTANAATALAVSTTSLPQATLAKAYTTYLTATGGTSPYNWKVVSGTHPPGFALNGDQGKLYGTPTKGGSFPLTFSVTDSSKPAQTKTVVLTVVIATPAFSITSTTLPAATQGASYSSTLQATGGTPSYFWSIASGKLPAGLILAGSTISGKPSVTGTFPITVAVRDSSSPDLTKSVSLSIVVAKTAAAKPALTITSATLASGTDGTAYSEW